MKEYKKLKIRAIIFLTVSFWLVIVRFQFCLDWISKGSLWVGILKLFAELFIYWIVLIILEVLISLLYNISDEIFRISKIENLEILIKDNLLFVPLHVYHFPKYEDERLSLWSADKTFIVALLAKGTLLVLVSPVLLICGLIYWITKFLKWFYHELVKSWELI